MFSWLKRKRNEAREFAIRDIPQAEASHLQSLDANSVQQTKKAAQRAQILGYHQDNLKTVGQRIHRMSSAKSGWFDTSVSFHELKFPQKILWKKEFQQLVDMLINDLEDKGYKVEATDRYETSFHKGSFRISWNEIMEGGDRGLKIKTGRLQ